jgi:integrase/recombinase XerD
MNQSTLALTFQKAVEGFLLTLHAEGYSTSTIQIYKWGLSKFGEMVPENISGIRKEDLLKVFASARDSGLKPASLQNIWIPMRSFFEWTHKEFNLPRPDTDIPCPKAEAPTISPFNDPEIRRLLSACNYTERATSLNRKAFRMKRPTADRDKAIILTLLDTGVRVSELARLIIQDINLESGEIQIRPFGSGLKSKPRAVYIGKLSRSTLWRYLAGKQLEQNDYLFTTTNGYPMNRTSIRQLLVRIGEKAEINNVYPHRFRHTFAIQYLRNGGDIFTLQRILGHSSLEMVKRYLAIAKADCETAHRKASPVDNWRLC